MSTLNSKQLERSFSSVKSLIGLQLASRLLTSVLNQGLVRLASPQAYGTISVQFELLMSTILFLSREGVRNSLLRVWPQRESTNVPKAVQCTNLAALPALLGIPITFLTVVAYMCTASEDARRQPHFYLALLTYVAASVIELLSEPMHNRAMGEACTSIRVRAEGLGITSKSVVTYLTLLYDIRFRERQFTLMAFALGQLAYSIVLFVAYRNRMPTTRLWPTRLSHPSPGKSTQGHWHRSFFDPNVLYLSMTMTLQSVVKHFLSEGDKFLVSYWSPLRDQGGYAIANNYGSLIARIVFQPVEEVCRVHFSRVLSSSADFPRSGSDSQPANPALQQAADAITALLSIQLVVSLLVTTFGSLYLPIVMQVLLPLQYLSTSAPQVLSAWVWYIPLLAINGGLEAFHSSIATADDLRKQSWWMLGYSVVYVASATLFYKLGCGEPSLVYANIVNLSARILYTTFYILRFFEKHSSTRSFNLKDVLPDWRFLVVITVSYVVVSFNEGQYRIMELLDHRLFSVPVLLHVSLGATMGLVCVAIWWMSTGKQVVTKIKVKIA